MSEWVYKATKTGGDQVRLELALNRDFLPMSRCRAPPASAPRASTR